jgi:hypothetical protein
LNRYHIKIVPEKPFSYAAYLIPFASVIGLSLLGLVGFVVKFEFIVFDI